MKRPALLLALLAVVALATVVGASPQPTPVCGFCGDRFEDAAADVGVDGGVDATVAESTVVVEVHENGSATWTVRNHLTNGSEAFQDDPERLSSVARSMADSSWGVTGDVRFVDARMDGDTAVLVYRDPDAAERHAGLLVVDYLHDEGYEPWYHVNADSFTIRGPEGTVVSNGPESGAVDGRSVTWRGAGGGELYEAPDLEGSPFVVFGPDRSTETRLRTRAALALATVPIVVRSVQSYLLWQTVVFAVALGAVVAAFRRRPVDPGPRPLAGVLAGLGAVGIAAPVLAGAPGWVGGPQLLALGLGLLALDEQVRRYVRTPRRLALAAGGALAVDLLVLAGLGGALSHPAPVVFGLRGTTVALPLAAMLPLGGALADPDRRLLPWGALAVAGFAAVAPAILNFADPPSGLGGGLAAVFLFLLAVVFPLVGTLVVALGHSLASRARDRPTYAPA